MSKLKVNVFKSHIIKKDYDIYILSKYCSIKDLNAIRKINHERLLKSEVTTGQTYKCKSFINNTCSCFKPCMFSN